MSSKIIELMRVAKPNHDLQWLRQALQAAIELELATLPPYLCGLWCLKDQQSDPAKLIRSIVFDEMAHFGFACNLLCSTGMQPAILSGYDNIQYPGKLPGGVRPKCDPSFFPCDPDFKVVLGFDSLRSFAKMCMQIEYPEDPVPRPVLAVGETFPSIGEFYDAIRDAFNSNQFEYKTEKQVESPYPKVYIIDNLSKAIAAISLIQQQGEGASRYPFSAPNKLAHFYAFGEIYYGRRYVFDPEKKTGDWTGDSITIPDVFPMTPVPLKGYSDPPEDVVQCDRDFTALLKTLDEAWMQGGEKGKEALQAAIEIMDSLGTHARMLLQKSLPRKGGSGIYGPQFRKV